MAVDQRHPFFKFLGHHHQGFIDGTVPVGMIFTHGVTYNTGAFPVRPVIADAQFMHIIQSPSLHWF